MALPAVLSTAPYRPGTNFHGYSGEVGDQVEQMVTGMDELVDAWFFRAHGFKEFLAFFLTLQLSDIRLYSGADQMISAFSWRRRYEAQMPG